MTEKQKQTILEVAKKSASETIVDLIYQLGPDVIELNELGDATLLLYAIDRLTTPDLKFMVDEINWKVDEKLHDYFVLMCRFMIFLRVRA